MKLYMACLHRAAINNTMNEIHIAATELRQLLAQNTNMFGEATVQCHCRTLCKSKVTWKN